MLCQDGLHLLPTGLPLPYRQGRAIQGEAVGGGQATDYRFPEAQSCVDNDLVSRTGRRVGSEQNTGHLGGYESLNHDGDGGLVLAEPLALPISDGACRPQ